MDPIARLVSLELESNALRQEIGILLNLPPEPQNLRADMDPIGRVIFLEMEVFLLRLDLEMLLRPILPPIPVNVLRRIDNLPLNPRRRRNRRIIRPIVRNNGENNPPMVFVDNNNNNNN